MKIMEYILTDSSYNSIYKTFDLRDLATEILRLNNEIQYINSKKEYEEQVKFSYHLIVESKEILDLEEVDKR